MTFNIKTDIRVQYEYPSGTWNSIESDTYEVAIDRGVTVEQGVFARPDVGTAQARLSKRSLNDLMTAPEYKSNQNFRIQFKLGTVWFSLFTGIIQNITINYVSETKKLDINITAVDLMKIFLGTRLGTYVITGTTSNRSFRNVMGNLGTAVHAIDSRINLSQQGTGGSATTQDLAGWDDTTAGEIVTQFLDAELGWTWADVGGSYIVYNTRNDINTKQGTTWGSYGAITVSNVHSTSQYHVCMDHMEMSYNSDDIANKVKVTRTLTGSTATSVNSSSVSSYGEQSANFEVEFDNTGLSTLGSWASAVATAATPKSIKSVSVPVVRRDGNISLIAGHEVGDTLQIEFAASGYTTLQEIYLVSRIGHTINADHWEMNIGLWKGI
jgi:hypothetical protein